MTTTTTFTDTDRANLADLIVDLSAKSADWEWVGRAAAERYFGLVTCGPYVAAVQTLAAEILTAPAGRTLTRPSVDYLDQSSRIVARDLRDGDNLLRGTSSDALPPSRIVGRVHVDAGAGMVRFRHVDPRTGETLDGMLAADRFVDVVR